MRKIVLFASTCRPCLGHVAKSGKIRPEPAVSASPPFNLSLPKNARGVSPDFCKQLFQTVTISAGRVRLTPVFSIIPVERPHSEIPVELKLCDINAIEQSRINEQWAGFYQGYPVSSDMILQRHGIPGSCPAKNSHKIFDAQKFFFR
jgi:hypothetical protein